MIILLFLEKEGHKPENDKQFSGKFDNPGKDKHYLNPEKRIGDTGFVKVFLAIDESLDT